MPEVSLVAILDADKEGFLRSDRSLIQTIGRAARNLNGRAILYADAITGSMERAINETQRRRTSSSRSMKRMALFLKVLKNQYAIFSRVRDVCLPRLAVRVIRKSQMTEFHLLRM